MSVLMRNGIVSAVGGVVVCRRGMLASEHVGVVGEQQLSHARLAAPAGLKQPLDQRPVSRVAGGVPAMG